MQANGAEMLRLACCLGTENGISIAPVHDAILITAPIDQLEDDVTRLRAYMAEASRIVLAGFELRTDVKSVNHPDHFSDEKGAEFWAEVMNLLWIMNMPLATRKFKDNDSRLYCSIAKETHSTTKIDRTNRINKIKETKNPWIYAPETPLWFNPHCETPKRSISWFW
jgi:hypothetical protein